VEGKNVLICLDGSESAYRVADHVGFILEPVKNHEVTVLTVDRGDDFSEDALNSMRSKTLDHFKENGVPEERIRFKTVMASNVPRTILREAEDGVYGAVAVGRRRSKPGFHMGSVSTRLFRELEGPALWISY
jgi:hypothetical protein